MSDKKKHITIMVADDEEIVLSLISDTLEEEGFKVLTSLDSYECLAQFDSKKIDILISDIRMPKMNGIELVKKAKKIQPNLAVVFMTGYANLNSAKEAIKQGASDYILKPFDLTEIRNAVDKAVTQIQKESNSNNNNTQLDNLNHLNKMLFTGGDTISQIQMSLKFAVTHSKADYGSFLYWNSNKTEFKMITVHEENSTIKELSAEKLLPLLDSADFTELTEPKVVFTPVDNPFMRKANPTTEFSELVIPTWYSEKQPMVMIRVRRTSSDYGILMINASEESRTTINSNLKFLGITAHQLALSLENIELLEKSQTAYAKLKELQDQTIQLEKMATKGEMSAEIGHELNNFLGVVMGSLSLLEHQINQKNYDKLDKLLKAMNDNIGKIKNFTSNLMELKSISTKVEVFCFNKILVEVVDYLKPQKRYQKVDLLCEPLDQTILIKADILHIQQLLYNLFNNAADAMINSQTKTIHIKTKLCVEKKCFLLSIKDSGEGIKQENIQKVFTEKFTTKESGHGFGLLVCKRIIDSHKGELTINSKVGEGTEITIQFPIETELTPNKAKLHLTA